MPFKPALQFVVTNASSQKRDQNENQIRRHAQRQAWRRRRREGIERVKRFTTSHVILDRGWQTQTLASTISSLEESLKDDSSHDAKPSLRDLGSGGSDPFDAAIVKIDPKLHSHLVFFATSMWPVYSQSLQSVSFLSSFGSLAIHDKGLLYAIAASSAVRQRSRNYMLPSKDSKFLIDQDELLFANLTVQQIRRRLSEPDNQTSDATIGIIAFLAMLEAVDSGRLDQSLMHIRAIRQLINAREKTRLIPWLWYERILAADIKTACIGLSQPLLPQLETAQSSRQVQELVQSHYPAEGHRRMLLSASVRSISPFGRNIFESIQGLTHLLQISRQMGRSWAGSDCAAALFSYQRLALEQALLNHLATTSLDRSSFESCLLLGVLLFVNTAFWVHFESSCAILGTLCRQMRQQLSGTQAQAVFQGAEQRNLKAWLLFLGCHASRGMNSQQWFLNHLKEIAYTSPALTPSGFRQSLLDYPYVRTVYDNTLEDILAHIFSHSDDSAEWTP